MSRVESRARVGPSVPWRLVMTSCFLKPPHAFLLSVKIVSVYIDSDRMNVARKFSAHTPVDGGNMITFNIAVLI